MTFRPLALSLEVLLTAAACTTGTDEDDTDVTADDTTQDDTTDDTDPATTTEQWIVGGWLSTEDAWTGYLTLLDDISSSGEIDLDETVAFEGDFVYEADSTGTVYAGLGGESLIERWEVVDGRLEQTGEINFAAKGVTETLGGGRNVIQFVDDERTWYFDSENLKVIEWNRSSMTITGDFSIAGLQEDDTEWGLNFVHRDGDRFIVTARYWTLDDETAVQLTRAAIIDSTDNSVTYIDDTRCGNIGFNATDADGNLYLASHQGQAVSEAAGFEGEDPTPLCILRINAGESEFDDSYFVDLAELTDDAVVGGLLQGPDGTAYMFQYEGEAITGDNWRTALRGDDWAIHTLELGNEAATYAAVPGLGGSTSYGTSFDTTVDGVVTPFLVAVDAEFSEGSYYDMTDATSPVQQLEFPGFPGHAIALH